MKSFELSQNWKLSRENDFSGCMQGLSLSHFPMQAAEVLLEHGIIEEPWKKGKATEYKWIGESDWIYETHFSLLNTHGIWFLDCQGLDLFAEILLNGQTLCRWENALMPMRTLIPSGLLQKENILQIRFTSTYRELLRRSAFLPEESSLQQRAIALNLRKNFNDFSEYLGQKPYFIRMGVFGAVTLLLQEEGMLQEAWLDTSLSEDLSVGTVTVQALGAADTPSFLQLSLLSPDGRVEAQTKSPLHKDGSGTLSVSIQDPLLWYPWGYGSQTLYQVRLTLLSENETVLDNRIWQTGFRKLAMPKPLHFEINNMPVKLWGGNWAPQSAGTKRMHIASCTCFGMEILWPCGYGAMVP